MRVKNVRRGCRLRPNYLWAKQLDMVSPSHEPVTGMLAFFCFFIPLIVTNIVPDVQHARRI